MCGRPTTTRQLDWMWILCWCESNVGRNSNQCGIVNKHIYTCFNLCAESCPALYYTHSHMVNERAQILRHSHSVHARSMLLAPRDTTTLCNRPARNGSIAPIFTSTYTPYANRLPRIARVLNLLGHTMHSVGHST